MWQFAEAVRGPAHGCAALGVPEGWNREEFPPVTGAPSALTI